MSSSSSNSGTGPLAFEVRVQGCRVNQAEARRIRHALLDAGFATAGSRRRPDLVIAHTCAVTAEAQRQGAQLLRRIRACSPGAHVVLSGCGAAPGLIDPAPADAVLPPGPCWPNAFSAFLKQFAPAGSAPLQDKTAGRVKAFLKIQDGCDLRCAYCIVPALRGPARDRPMGEILDEARRFVDSGCRELVVTGICAGRFGRRAAPGESLPDLLLRLASLPGLARLRISSLHPSDLTRELLDAWARARHVLMPHLHLPLQSGSDRILRAMRRGYSSGMFLRALDRARAALDEPEVTSDVIAGFPGETGDDAERTLAFCQRAGFSRLHVFPFSPRPGTTAALRTDGVAARVVRERAARLRALSRELFSRAAARWIGRTAPVLAESYRAADGTLSGYTAQYLAARFPGPSGLSGRIVRVRIRSADEAGLHGDASPEPAGVNPPLVPPPTV